MRLCHQVRDRSFTRISVIAPRLPQSGPSWMIRGSAGSSREDGRSGPAKNRLIATRTGGSSSQNFRYMPTRCCSARRISSGSDRREHSSRRCLRRPLFAGVPLAYDRPKPLMLDFFGRAARARPPGGVAGMFRMLKLCRATTLTRRRIADPPDSPSDHRGAPCVRYLLY
jgi:hypothetical protein